MCAVCEEIDIAKAGAEMVTTLAEASGSLEPSKAFWGAMTSRIDAYFYPRTVRLAMRMAENIKASGLPPKAYSEIKTPLVKAILEAGSMEDDRGMQERWANLLASALTVTGTLPVALARILADLEPVEAATLDRISTNENADGTQVVDLPSAR